jgi:sporadic carbohydrate cluster protein (TIGR04323 family)
MFQILIAHTQLKKNEGLVFISLYVLPKEKGFRSKILNSLRVKKIECHFIFENIILKSNNDLKKINSFFKLRDFTNN